MINALPGGGSRSILLSKRANVFYLDRVRVMVRHERVVYQVADGDMALDYNLPDCNTSLLLLGKGSSITDAAARCLARSGVVVGFAGTGGTPAHCLTDYVFLTPADEYRPTEYCQRWVVGWMDSTWKLSAAKALLLLRLSSTRAAWDSPSRSPSLNFPEPLAQRFREDICRSTHEAELLLAEARWAKACYAHLARGNGLDFSRQPGLGADRCNSLLDHGNYLMYGLATVALHALGIPHAFPLLHGKTRRGALVFDVADLCKDAYVLPLAFEFGRSKDKRAPQQFRQALLSQVQQHDVLDQMVETIKRICGMQVIDFEKMIERSAM